MTETVGRTSTGSATLPIADAPKGSGDRLFTFSFNRRAFWDEELNKWVLCHPLHLEAVPSHARYVPRVKS